MALSWHMAPSMALYSMHGLGMALHNMAKSIHWFSIYSIPLYGMALNSIASIAWPSISMPALYIYSMALYGMTSLYDMSL